MQQLSRPDTLLHAGVASLITTLACVPRLARWQERTEALGFLLLMVAFTSFVLWAFVVAWSPRPGLAWWRWPRDPQAWAIAVVAGLVGAVVLHTCIDPTLRQLTPQDYPDTPGAWLAGTLFTLAFVQVFLCFAPFALFLRLFHNTQGAILGTLALGILILTLQLRSNPVTPGIPFTVVLLTVRLMSGMLSLYLLLRGGPWLVWTCLLLVQLRLLPSAAGLL